MEMFLTMCAAMGCRRGEVLALRWSDIAGGIAIVARSLTQTRERGLEFKSVKNEKPHAVALDEDTLAALESHRKRQDAFREQFGPNYAADLDLIFANPDGTPFKPDSISATVSRICRRLKLPKGANLHALRHTHASSLLSEGVPLPVVSARLGHSSMRTTSDIYAHMINGQDQEAANKWAEFKRRARIAAGVTPNQKEQVQ
jgi:integrase